jgi:protein tyrosine phosphatase (PTP) superfamily phosphohydrolase (DUF442 family)
MTMTLSIYVGPYLEVEKTFDMANFGYPLVSDGRMEAAEPGEPLRLIPNQTLPGVDRQMDFNKHCDTPVVEITTAQMDAEKVEFSALTEPVFAFCRERGIHVRLKWGIVPCYS